MSSAPSAGVGLAWIRTYPADWLARLMGLTLAAQGALVRLWLAYWLRGPLPADADACRRLAGADEGEWQRAWPEIRSHFEECDGALHCQWLDDERANADARRDAAARGASLTNAKRWGTPRQSPSESQSESHSDHSLGSGSGSGSASESRGESAQPAAARRPPAVSRGTRIPEGFALSTERRAYAVEQRVDADREFAKFLNHWQAASGRNAAKRDWDAAWRTWCLKAVDYGNSRAGVGPKLSPPTQEAIEAARRAEIAKQAVAHERPPPDPVEAAANRARLHAAIRGTTAKLRVGT